MKPKKRLSAEVTETSVESTLEASNDARKWATNPKNPHLWSRRRKWGATLTACYMSCLVSVAASAYSQAVEQMTIDLHTSNLLAVSGISFFTISCSVFPLFLTPLGEAYGRQPVYIASYAIFFLFFLPNALARNVQTVLVSRFMCGAAGSVGSTMVGGTLSDLWEKDERSLPMSLFAASALLGTPLGLIAFTWAGGSVSWRWIFWTLLMLAVPSAALIALYFREETLPPEARKLLKQTAARIKTSSPPTTKFQAMNQVLVRSALRPLYFLATEPITLALSTWIAFAWGTLYLFLEAVPLVFAPYGFDHAHKTRGASFVGIAVGTLIGLSLHMCVLRYRTPTRAPEERLPEACVGAVVFTVGFFIFAWTAMPNSIPWIVPQIGTAFIMTGLYMVYICIFDYLADCYGSYSSSAIAAQSFLRNILATAFPLIAERMYRNLTYPWASSLLGFAAFALAFVPFVLLFYGKQLRKRSPYASSQTIF